MNKIIIITDFRAPKEGDRFILYDGSSPERIEIADAGYETALRGNNRYIVGAELEVPEGAKCLAWSFRDCNKDIPDQHGTVILPRKTVKKWLFRFEGFNGVSCITENHHTEEEMRNGYCTGEHWRKVEGSEVEVEE